MADNVGFIAHTSERHAHIFATDCLGNGMCNGCLADARRAYKADNLPADIRRELFDSQNFQDAFFDLRQSVMVAVKNMLRFLEIDMIARRRVPRKFKAGIKIALDYARLVRTFRHFHQALAFLHQLVMLKLGQLCFRNALLQVVCVLLRIVALAQFVGNGAHLFTKKILFLVLVDLILCLFADLRLNGKNLNFIFQDHRKFFQPVNRVKLLQNLLLLRVIEHDVGSNIIGEFAAVFFLYDADDDVRRNMAVVLNILFKKVSRVAHQCFRTVRWAVRPCVDAAQIGHEIRVGL